jgi:hypothetical protein
MHTLEMEYQILVVARTTITDVEGNINSAKCVDILDNNRLPVVLKFENYQWIFQDDSATGTGGGPVYGNPEMNGALVPV